MFAAIRMPPDVAAALARAQETLAVPGSRIGWTRPGDFHLTLCFFGDRPPAALAALRAVLDAAAAATPPFRFAVAGAGAFGPARAPRVLWAGVPDPPPALADLAARLADGARAAGVPFDARPFRAHVTLGRVRAPAGAPALTSALRSLMYGTHGTVDADRLSLMAAAEPAGANRYRLLHEVPLKG